MERGAKSLADDLGMDRGVVPSRAAASLRSAETNPLHPRDLSAFDTGRTNSRGVVGEREKERTSPVDVSPGPPPADPRRRAFVRRGRVCRVARPGLLVRWRGGGPVLYYVYIYYI